MTGPADRLLVERVDRVLLLTLNRPRVANALDRETLFGLIDALAAAAADDTVAAVVLTGAGDRHFCAGMDLSGFSDRPLEPAEQDRLDRLYDEVYPKPLVAAVNGAAVGGGFELVLLCDLVVAAEHARFGLPEVKRGLVPGGGGTRLPARIPVAVALEMGLTGEPVDAERARSLGLVNRVVPAAQVRGEALRLAGEVAANGPLAVRATKQLMYDVLRCTPMAAIRAAAAPVFASADAVEGARAFAEKRPPVWTGR